jgi:hypothetical protein
MHENYWMKNDISAKKNYMYERERNGAHKSSVLMTQRIASCIRVILFAVVISDWTFSLFQM